MVKGTVPNFLAQSLIFVKYNNLMYSFFITDFSDGW